MQGDEKLCSSDVGVGTSIGCGEVQRTNDSALPLPLWSRFPLGAGWPWYVWMADADTSVQRGVLSRSRSRNSQEHSSITGDRETATNMGPPKKFKVAIIQMCPKVGERLKHHH